MDAELRDTLKLHKLRWKNILNEANDRILVMGGVRPVQSDELTNELDNLLSIKSALLYSVDLEEKRPASLKQEKSMFFMPSICLNSLINSPINSLDDVGESIQKHHKEILEILLEMKEGQKENFPLTISNSAKDTSAAAEPATSNGFDMAPSKMTAKGEGYH